MRHVRPARLAAMAILVLAAPATAQNYGPQPGYQPNPYQPNPYQPGPYQPNPYQPGPMPQGGQATGAPSLAGTWSGQSIGPAGTIQQADAFSPDGRFVSVGRMPNGFLARNWGTYRATQVGPNQLRVQFQLEGWLPREICQQQAGGQPECQPAQIPTTDTSLVTFNSPNQLQSMSETTAGATVNEVRDNQPALLQAQAPQRWLTILQPSAAPAPAPVIGGYTPRYTPGPNRPYMNGCPGDDGARIRCRYSGRLVPSGGCLQCVD